MQTCLKGRKLSCLALSKVLSGREMLISPSCRHSVASKQCNTENTVTFNVANSVSGLRSAFEPLWLPFCDLWKVLHKNRHVLSVLLRLRDSKMLALGSCRHLSDAYWTGKRIITFLILLPNPIAQLVALRTWEQEVARSIPGSANILSEDWW